MNDLKLDARRWRFLRNPESYIEGHGNDLRKEPLIRQFKTVQEILTRFQKGHGVLLADDVGLGKTTIGALVAWVAAHQGLIVRIYAPNGVLRRRWEFELKRHVPMLSRVWGNEVVTKQGEANNRIMRRIRVMTHYELKKKTPQKCDVMIVDEAHRAKGKGSALNEVLRNSQKNTKRTLILTATPFSIRIEELEQLLGFVGAGPDKLSAVREYADLQAQLYAFDQACDADTFAENLVKTAKTALDQLRPFLIRHGVDSLKEIEKKYFGKTKLWEFADVESVNEEQLSLLLRVDRIKHLCPTEKGKRKNDPRFHIGWMHLCHELKRMKESVDGQKDRDPILSSHIDEAIEALHAIEKQPHPKMLAVAKEVGRVVDGGEKVLIFCHHRSTASELLAVLEKQLKTDVSPVGLVDEAVWRSAWQELCIEKNWFAFGVVEYDEGKIRQNKKLIEPFIDWLCTKGVQSQISQWITQPALDVVLLKCRLSKDRVRGVKFYKAEMPTILEAAEFLLKTLLDPQSGSTRATLKNMQSKQQGLQVGDSHFPGLLDNGFRVMGAWDHEGEDAPKTLYTSKPDIVIALFNSPFGPDVLVATDRMSEGVDLHRYCRHLIHYELDPSPVRTIQRNGRVRRVDSWAARTKQPVEYAYPAFGGTRDEKAVTIMQQRIRVFGNLLGGVPPIKDEELDKEHDHSYVEQVLIKAESGLKRLNGTLCVV
jgi:superfamily II DNA or RNA helicase